MKNDFSIVEAINPFNIDVLHDVMEVLLKI